MEAFHGKVFTADISDLAAWGILFPNILALHPASGFSKEECTCIHECTCSVMHVIGKGDECYVIGAMT